MLVEFFEHERGLTIYDGSNSLNRQSSFLTVIELTNELKFEHGKSLR